MVKSVVFHLGDPKTGSTSIQNTLTSKNYICDEVSLYFPAKINDIPLASSFFVERFKGSKDQRFRKLADKLDASDADIGVISAEVFDQVDPVELQVAVKKYLRKYAKTARYIAYVRPHADRLISTYAERLKRGFFNGSLEELLDQTKASDQTMYLERFTQWRKVFGKQFELRPMIRSELYKNCVVHDFLNFTFEGADFSLRNDPESNESLSLEDLVMMRDFHIQLGDDKALDGARHSIGWNFPSILEAIPAKKQTKLRIHADLMPEIVAHYCEDAKALDAAFFAGGPMLSALESAIEKTVPNVQSVALEDHFSADQVRTLRAWSGLIKKIISLDPAAVPKFLRQNQLAELLSSNDMTDIEHSA